MASIIVDAYVCGLSKSINIHIQTAIELGRVSSTTIMANMDDFEGAISMYNNLKDIASFGVHLNFHC